MSSAMTAGLQPRSVSIPIKTSDNGDLVRSARRFSICSCFKNSGGDSAADSTEPTASSETREVRFASRASLPCPRKAAVSAINPFVPSTIVVMLVVRSFSDRPGSAAGDNR